MMPQYARQVTPDYRGQRLAGMANEAAGGIGEAISRFGAVVGGFAAHQAHEKRYEAEQQQALADREAERMAIVAAGDRHRQLDERRIRRMLELKDPEKRKKLLAVEVDPETGVERSGYDGELDSFGDWMKEQTEDLTGNLSPRAKQIFDAEYNNKYATWATDYVNTVGRLEQEDVVSRARTLADGGRAAEALNLADLYRDKLGPEAHRQLSGELLVSGAMSELKDTAGIEGWEAARARMAEPEFLERWGLDLAEAAQMKGTLAGFVHDEAAIAERHAAAATDLLERKRLDEAWNDKIDMDAVRNEFVTGAISEATYKQIREIRTKGPRSENDRDTFMAAERWLSNVRAKPARKEEALTWLKANASQLTATTWQGYVTSIEKAGDPGDPAGSPSFKLLDGLIDENFFTDKEGVLQFGGASGAEAESAYIDAKQRFRKWVTDHPDATDEQINAFYGGLVTPIVVPGILERIWDNLGWSAEWNVGIAKPKEQFALADPDGEPTTQREFEDVVKSLPNGSEEQRAYYERWAGKWR